MSRVLRALSILLGLAIVVGACASTLASGARASSETSSVTVTSTSTGVREHPVTTATSTSSSASTTSTSTSTSPGLYSIPAPGTSTVEASTSTSTPAPPSSAPSRGAEKGLSVVRETVQPTSILPARGKPRHRRKRRRAARHGKGASGAAGADGPSASEIPGAPPIGATVGLPPEPLAAAGIGGQAGNPLAGTPFPPGAVPGFFIESYRVPPFLLAIYQSAAARYGVPWEVLAGINEVETDYGSDLSISSAGAEGWMQFLPQTWAEYGVDATGAGVRDPYNPADAIFAAGRYLRAAGAAQSLTGAIFAYNHSSVYVESVMLRARLLAGIPPALLKALTAIGEGHAPGGARARRAPSPHEAAAGEAADGGLTPAQWRTLTRRLAELPQPHVPLAPTSAALPDRPGGVDLPPPALGSAPVLDLAPQAATGLGAGTPGAAGVGGASSSPASGGLSFQPELGLPAVSVNMVGTASDEESGTPGDAAGRPGVVWGTGEVGVVPASVGSQQIAHRLVLLRHVQGVSGWQVVPVEGGGEKGGEELNWTGSPSVDAIGGMVLRGTVEVEPKKPASTILTREGRGAFAPAPVPKPRSEPGGVLEPGETLYPTKGTLLFTAIDEPTGHTGALMVPGAASLTSLLHYDGTQWTHERICTQYAAGTGACTDSASELKALAIAAPSPPAQGESVPVAWLLASSESEPLMLFKRVAAASGTPVWVQSQPPSWVPSGDEISARATGQMLSATTQGVWIDAKLISPSAPNEEADLSLLVDAASPNTILGTWCFPQVACGQGSLGAPLPKSYTSFAWPGTGDGTRILAGLGEGALLRLQGSGDFQYIVGAGGNSSLDAAFLTPEEGWISSVAQLGANSAQLEHVTANPTSTAPQAWPLPFRRPLTAIAAQPGTTPGEPGAQALAVGDRGQVARYVPGEGWTPEFLYNAAGVPEQPRLRGVAWPESGRAYAVGDGGAMWLWRADTGLWEPDPAKPLNFHANLTAIAFSPLNPVVGYAVGKQGALLSYDKTWKQQTLPSELAQADFTSVAFAGGEALATFRMVVGGKEVGGLAVNDGSGSGWHVDTSAQELLAGLHEASTGGSGEPPKVATAASVLSKVAALPDGGAVAAGPGVVIERDSQGAPWRFSSQPLPEAQNIAALAAIREGPSVRALVSADLDSISNPNNTTDDFLNIDNPPAVGFGQPGALIGPDPLPVSGYLLRETPSGWQDLQEQAYPNAPSIDNTDLPNWPDAVLALDVDQSGTRGWAVGGQTGGIVEQSSIGGAQFTSQSAAALRLGGDVSPPQSTAAPIAVPGGQVTFAVGGDAQCAGPCAALANEGIGPDAWLSAALARAAQIHEQHGELRAFLYTGAHVAEGAAHALSKVPSGFAREQQAYRSDLNAAGTLPVYVTPSPSDLDASGLATFAAAMGGDAPVGSAPAGTPQPPAGGGAYAVQSEGAGGVAKVRVIVLDFTASVLGAGELEWLSAQLAQARSEEHPAITIAMGSADIADPGAPNYDGQDAAALSAALLAGGASAYLFDSPGENRAERIGAGAGAIPAYGSGTLGYVPPPVSPEEFMGASGFLTVSVDVGARDPASNRAPVGATLIPNISQLGLDATGGTLLRRSSVSLFQGLARRPAGGLELSGGPGSSSATIAPDPYVPIPETCIGAVCSRFIAPEYTFTSSNPDIGDFVEQEPSNPNPLAVLQGSDGRPVHNSHSGLFCAFNPGTTTVTIATGGLSYSEQVTVQAGSVVQPCGTVPLVNPPAAAVSAPAPPPVAPAPASPPSSPAPLAVTPPPPPVAPVPAKPAPPLPPRPAPLPPPFFFRPLLAAPLLAIVLPPPPVLARPIPPSGAATVSVPAVAPKEEEEDEEAVENARASMSIYIPEDPHLPPYALLALLVIAAGAGTAIRRSNRGRHTRRTPALARARAARQLRW
jgi:Transglycosylase SLT domain